MLQHLPVTAATELASQDSEVALRMMWQVAEDERRLRNTAVALAKGSAKQRIATMLVDICGRLAVTSGASKPRVISLHQQEIADYLGMTSVHVNRTLRALREEGSVDVRVGAIAILDWAAIYDYAEPMLDIHERNAPEFRPEAEGVVHRLRTG